MRQRLFDHITPCSQDTSPRSKTSLPMALAESDSHFSPRALKVLSGPAVEQEGMVKSRTLESTEQGVS